MEEKLTEPSQEKKALITTRNVLSRLKKLIDWKYSYIKIFLYLWEKNIFLLFFSFSNALFAEERTDPYKWPLNIVAQVFSGVYDRERINVYMLGNPIIWFPHLILILLLPILIPMLIIRSGKHSLTAFISLSLMYFSHLLFILLTFLFL